MKMKTCGTVLAALLFNPFALAQTPAADRAADPEVVKLSTIEVVGQVDKSAYNVAVATVGSRFPEPVLDSPRSVQIVTAQMIADRAILDPQEALQNVAGTTRSGSYIGAGETFLLRGFQQTDLIKDGFRAGTAANVGLTATGPTDMANIDRIEFLKGPAGILYGRGEPGGVVNYITKSATFENTAEVQQSVGSDSFYRSQIGGNWNLLPDRVALRLDAAYENADSFINEMHGERTFVALATKWQVDPATTLTVRGEYSHDDRSTNPGLPYLDGAVLPGVPRDQYLGEPGFTEFTHKTSRGIAQLEHRWSENAVTTVSVHGRHSTEVGNYFLLYNFAGPLQDPVTKDIARAVSINDHLDENFTARIDQTLAANLSDSGRFRIRNQLLLSGEFERQTQNHHRILGSQVSINPYDPVYVGYAPLPLLPFPDFPLKLNEYSDVAANVYSVAAIDRLSIGDKIFLSAGGRMEWFRSNYSLNYPDPGTPFTNSVGKQRLSDFSPTAGVVVKPLQTLSLYFSYAESKNVFLNAFASPTATGAPLDPESSRQYELGAKKEWLDSRLTATAAVFEIEKNDVVGADPNNPLYSINSGSQRSRGIELEASGEILPGWRLTAQMSHTSAKITSAPNNLNVGNRRTGVPTNAGGLFTVYEFRSGALKGLGLGGGVFAASRVAVDDANSGTLPSYVQFDATTYYSLGAWKFQINLKNAFDRTYYYATSNSTMVQPAAGRTLLASVRYQF
ncbi:MAG TPA: TonB-dependent siderophore receptor [Opitutaceae bacterium]|nr:TonB-dependent siderophore receptor [Opitutaceae bacterium]